MFNKIKNAFNWYQEKSGGHPLTCFNGHNLKCKDIKDTILNLYCEFCNDYHQQYEGDWILSLYQKNYLDKRQLKIKPFFRWYDLWIGAYIDTKDKSLYVIPFPMLGLKFYWEVPSIFDELLKSSQDLKIMKKTIKLGNDGEIGSAEISILKNENGNVNRFETSQIFSEHKGQYKTKFYFRLEPETGVSADGISPVFVIETLEHDDPIDYEKWQNIIRQKFTIQAGVDEKYVVPLTKEEHDKQFNS